MVGVELIEGIVNLPALELGPGLLGKLGGGLQHHPTAKRSGGKNETSPPARSTNDASPGRVERCCFSRRGHFAAADATVERWREAEHREHPNLKRQERLFGRRVLVERFQETNCRVEDRGLALLLG